MPGLVHPLFAGEETTSLDELPRDTVARTLRRLGALTGEVHRHAANRPAW